VSAHGGSEDFLFRIDDVVTLRGLGTVVVGAIAHGVLRDGDDVEVWDEDRLVGRTRATLVLVRRIGGDGSSISLCLHDLDKSLLSSGQTVRRSA
jgi:translation elongation factor EF-Tu-like GTPase